MYSKKYLLEICRFKVPKCKPALQWQQEINVNTPSGFGMRIIMPMLYVT